MAASGTRPRAPGELGWLDPATGETRQIPLGAGSAPHGVIVGPDGAPWITDGGLNAIVRVDPDTEQVDRLPTAADRPQREPQHRHVRQRRHPVVHRPKRRLRTPRPGDRRRWTCSTRPAVAGRTASPRRPSGDVYYASLAGNYVGRIDRRDRRATVARAANARPGRPARLVGLARPHLGQRMERRTGRASTTPPPASGGSGGYPGDSPQAYAVYVDDRDIVWLSDFGGNALVRFDPRAKPSRRSRCPSDPSNVRQILGRPGEVWGAESAADQIVVVRYSFPVACETRSF